MLPTNAADTARPPKVPNQGLAPLMRCEADEEEPEDWPDEPVAEATPLEIVVVPAMSGARVSDVIARKGRKPTLLKIGE